MNTKKLKNIMSAIGGWFFSFYWIFILVSVIIGIASGNWVREVIWLTSLIFLFSSLNVIFLSSTFGWKNVRMLTRTPKGLKCLLVSDSFRPWKRKFDSIEATEMMICDIHSMELENEYTNTSRRVLLEKIESNEMLKLVPCTSCKETPIIITGYDGCQLIPTKRSNDVPLVRKNLSHSQEVRIGCNCGHIAVPVFMPMKDAFSFLVNNGNFSKFGTEMIRRSYVCAYARWNKNANMEKKKGFVPKIITVPMYDGNTVAYVELPADIELPAELRNNE